MPSEAKAPIVLLAEDSEDDAFFFRWTLRKGGLKCQLVQVADGTEAIGFLADCCHPDRRRNERCPDLVFLDLKMPGQTGFEVLEWIRAHPFDPALDVSVLSGSEHAINVDRATALGATAYFVKPLSADLLRARFTEWQLNHAATLQNARAEI